MRTVKIICLSIGLLFLSSFISSTEARSRKLTQEYLEELQFAMIDCVVSTKITIHKLTQINMKDLYSYADPDILALFSCFYKKIGYSDADGNLQYDEIKQMFKENFKLTKGQRSFLVDKCNKEGGDTDVTKIRNFGMCVQRQSCKLLGRETGEEGCILGLYDIRNHSMVTRKLNDIE